MTGPLLIPIKRIFTGNVPSNQGPLFQPQPLFKSDISSYEKARAQEKFGHSKYVRKSFKLSFRQTNIYIKCRSFDEELSPK